MRFAFLLMLSAGLLGCPATSECATGLVWNGVRCVSTDGGLEDAPQPADAGPCGGCTGPLVCNEDTNTCVACLGSDATSCPTGLLACVDETCVACDDDTDCDAVDASNCGTDNTCGGCEADPDCAHLSGTPVCDEDAGTCVACTPDTEAARCGANSCDPATFTCTTTPRSSVTTCGACLSDTECSQPDDRCVPMEFMGAMRPGGFCLRRGSAGCTTQPFRSPTPSRSSLSGAAPEVYCGIEESVTTCEAVLDLVADTSCTSNDDCGAVGLDDGRCETVNLAPNKCTYGCTATSQCVGGFMCPSMTFCGAP